MTAPDALSSLLASVDVSLRATVTGRGYRCTACGGLIPAGEAHVVRVAARVHGVCVEGWWQVVGADLTGRDGRAELVDLDRLGKEWRAAS